MAYSQAEVYNAWKPACVGPWARIAYPGHGVVSVRPAAAEAFRAKAQVYAAFGYQTRQADTGGQVCRTTASGGNSKHAPGIADDTNWTSNPYGTTRTDRPKGMNEAILRIRTKNGKQVFNNGIYWRSGKDPMHDEIVCLPSDLAHGIDWSTVAGSSATPAPPRPNPEPEPEPEPELPPPPPPPTEDEMFIMQIQNHPNWGGTTWEFFESSRKSEPPVRRMIPKAGGRADLMVALNVARGGRPVVISSPVQYPMLDTAWERWVDATPSNDYAADARTADARRQQAIGL